MPLRVSVCLDINADASHTKHYWHRQKVHRQFSVSADEFYVWLLEGLLKFVIKINLKTNFHLEKKVGPSLVLIFKLVILLPLVCVSNLTTHENLFFFLSSGIILLHSNKTSSFSPTGNSGISCLHGNILASQTTFFSTKFQLTQQ